jgi:tetratricopeptide (TPR) repeat protein
VLWHSFEPGIASFGLDGVITQVGLAIFGADFAGLSPADRQEVVEGLLAERRLLLIWDNFETVHAMPAPGQVTPPLEEAERAKVKGFLARLAAHGTSAVIITSRTPEDWLGQVRRIGVGGLAREEAAQYATQLLAPYPAAGPRRARRAFGELLEWLDGHPLSMRLILPRLQATSPEDLLAGLHGTAPLPGGDDPGGDRATSLAASISYSFTHLAEHTRRLLPAAGLCHGVADSDVLALFSGLPGVPGRFAGANGEDWARVLHDAARVGLLTALGAGMYRIHPALPAYLAAHWRTDDPGGYDTSRDAATRALATACAAFGEWLAQQIGTGDAGLAYTVIGLQRRTLGAMLSYALDHQMWDQAHDIAQPLDAYWKAQGLGGEASAWTDLIQAATSNPDGTPPELGTPAGALWLGITGAQANREQQAGQLEDAEHTYRQILDTLRAQPHSRQQQTHIAAATHNLGVVAQDRGQFDQAEDWYRQSLAIKEDLGNRPGVANSYHQLGTAAQDRGQLDQAEDWYRQSLAIREELGNRPGMADSYHQLGRVAQDRGRLDQAEDWYRQSLAIKEDLGDRPGMAVSYHQLGRVAELQGQLEEAEDWYRRSLAISEDLGDRPGMAFSYGQLGLLAERRGQPRQALDWMVRCVTLFPEFPHPATGPGPEHLARLTAQLGMGALETSWRQATGGPLPEAVRGYITAHPDHAR